MNEKVILISVDGMRPDGFLSCGNPFIHELMKKGSYTLNAKTVFPSITLPCHMSMFHSVAPDRHGITTNLYMPPVRPINGLMEQIHMAGKKCAMFYGWEPLRDISRPESLTWASFINAYADENTDRILAEDAVACIQKYAPDFVFLYMVETDDKGGHDNGWMTEEYLRRVSLAIDNIKMVLEQCPDYTVVITADHGGHERIHGTELPEDMTIPMFFIGDAFTPGKELSGVSILDLAPTIADLMKVYPAPQWEGKSLLKAE